MKRNGNINQNPLKLSENGNRGQLSLKCFSAIKGILYADIFRISTIYNEKLPIIYANIRV